jgi:RNA polymerase sigma-70 factor (ECF subfamily)
VLANLPLKQREVLLLRFVDGFSLDEIADALEIPLGTVKSRLHTALNTLRDDPRTRELIGE